MSGRADGPTSLRCLAPAKLNLFLHVVGRRDDGYHLIQSVMRLIDLADELTVEVRDDGRVCRRGDVDGVAEDDDLAIRAARLLQAASGTTAGASIGIDKRIPMGGGLGGGSSDAATVLLALNGLWDLDWSRERLMALGARLGADVPFFVGGTDAFVEGIGERVTPMSLPDAFYAVVHPGVAVPTAVVFGAPELTRDGEVLKISDFSKSGFDFVAPWSDGPAEVSGPVLRNHLEAVATSRFAPVRDALDWLSRGSDRGLASGDWSGARGVARMSGSGACVFREFDSREAAAACIARLPGAWTGWSVGSVATHPLADAADRRAGRAATG